MRGDESGVEAGFLEIVIFENPQIIRRGGLTPETTRSRKARAPRRKTARQSSAPNNQFGAHRIVIRRDFVAGVNGGVGAHARPAGGIVFGDAPETGLKIAARVFALMRTPLKSRASKRPLASSTGALPAAMAICSWTISTPVICSVTGVLDLQAGVHLEEEKLAPRVLQKLDGAGVLIAGGAGDFDGALANDLALDFAQLRRGGDFDEFLVAALDRAIAVEKMDDVAFRIAEDLDFDMARIDESFSTKSRRRRTPFRIRKRRAETGGGFRGRCRIAGCRRPPPPARL